MADKFEIAYKQDHSQGIYEDLNSNKPHFSAQDYNFPEVDIAFMVPLNTFVFKLVKFCD